MSTENKQEEVADKKKEKGDRKIAEVTLEVETLKTTHRFSKKDADNVYQRTDMKGSKIPFVKAALEIEIERNHPDSARYWAARLVGSNHIADVFSHLITLAAASVGPAANRFLSVVNAAYSRYYNLRLEAAEEAGKGVPHPWFRLRNNVEVRYLVDGCVEALCAAFKSNACLHALYTLFYPIYQQGEKDEMEDLPDSELDHTLANALQSKSMENQRIALRAATVMIKKGRYRDLNCFVNDQAQFHGKLLQRAVEASNVVKSQNKDMALVFLPICQAIFFLTGPAVTEEDATVWDMSLISKEKLKALEDLYEDVIDESKDIPSQAKDFRTIEVQNVGDVRRWIESKEEALEPRSSKVTSCFSKEEILAAADKMEAWLKKKKVEAKEKTAEAKKERKRKQKEEGEKTAEKKKEKEEKKAKKKKAAEQEEEEEEEEKKDKKKKKEKKKEKKHAHKHKHHKHHKEEEESSDSSSESSSESSDSSESEEEEKKEEVKKDEEKKDEEMKDVKEEKKEEKEEKKEEEEKEEEETKVKQPPKKKAKKAAKKGK